MRARLRDRRVLLLAVLACAALAVAAAVVLLDAPDEPWDSPRGRADRAAFVAGCRHDTSGLAPWCGCLFQELTSGPPGDTPAGFAGVGRLMRAALQGGASAMQVPQVRAALSACEVNVIR